MNVICLFTSVIRNMYKESLHKCGEKNVARRNSCQSNWKEEEEEEAKEKYSLVNFGQ